jgi:hypothetical protein
MLLKLLKKSKKYTKLHQVIFIFKSVILLSYYMANIAPNYIAISRKVNAN